MQGERRQSSVGLNITTLIRALDKLPTATIDFSVHASFYIEFYPGGGTVIQTDRQTKRRAPPRIRSNSMARPPFYYRVPHSFSAILNIKQVWSNDKLLRPALGTYYSAMRARHVIARRLLLAARLVIGPWCWSIPESLQRESGHLGVSTRINLVQMTNYIKK